MRVYVLSNSGTSLYAVIYNHPVDLPSTWEPRVIFLVPLTYYRFVLGETPQTLEPQTCLSYHPTTFPRHFLLSKILITRQCLSPLAQHLKILDNYPLLTNNPRHPLTQSMQEQYLKLDNKSDIENTPKQALQLMKLKSEQELSKDTVLILIKKSDMWQEEQINRKLTPVERTYPPNDC